MAKKITQDEYMAVLQQIDAKTDAKIKEIVANFQQQSDSFKDEESYQIEQAKINGQEEKDAFENQALQDINAAAEEDMQALQNIANPYVFKGS